ncbi:MAG: hypothetical protein FJZ00_07415 [Candidatus Sericytochromatia bacterium]|uniref:Uncharacterized protein n=1 Tax=Candidatus Tanganyikabacteria bacterium TaxID=2961651 RepID=A0A937X6B2_9BACT|nr:hypothetical protein [Candidatus Tanganyikabacteria bacterium]
MLRHHLDQALEPIAKEFNAQILARGEELELTLTAAQKVLLDDLEGIHFRRSSAMVVASFDLGVEVGKALCGFRLRTAALEVGP